MCLFQLWFPWGLCPVVGLLGHMVVLVLVLLRNLHTVLYRSEVAQSCLTLCDPMDCSLPCSSIHGIFQARVLEWVTISFSRKWKWKWSRSVVSDSLRPHGLWPTRFLCPWDFPGKNTGVGCHFLLHAQRLELVTDLENIEVPRFLHPGTDGKPMLAVRCSTSWGKRLNDSLEPSTLLKAGPQHSWNVYGFSTSSFQNV